MRQLDGKVVLITGSTQGIGAATARACVAAGANVMIHGRKQELAEAMVAELGADKASYVCQDLADEQAARIIMDATLDHFGQLNVLVNNAGIFPRNDIDSLDTDNYKRIMDVNLRTPLFLCKEAVKAMRKTGCGGSIVNIGSMNAHTGQTDLLVYSISKGGLMTMTRNLADALSDEKIRVNQLNVGWTVTETERELQRSLLHDDWESEVPKLFAPTGQLMRPEEIAHHVVFWASDYSAPVTGQVYACEQYPIAGRNVINEVQSLLKSCKEGE